MGKMNVSIAFQWVYLPYRYLAAPPLFLLAELNLGADSF